MNKNEFQKLLNQKHENRNPYHNAKPTTSFSKKPLFIGAPLVMATLAASVALAFTFRAPGTNQNTSQFSLNSPQKAFNSKNLPTLSPTFIDGVNQFAYNFTKQVYDEKGNGIYSPLSMVAAFSMLKDGAKGNSNKQLDDLFHQGVNKEQMKNMLLYNAKNVDDEYEKYYLDIAQSIFLDSGFKERVYQDYLDILTDYYFAEGYSGSLSSSAMHQVLADWINQKTNNFLDKKAEDFEDLAGVMWLVNTVYLRTSWSKRDSFEYGKRNYNNVDGSISSVDYFCVNEAGVLYDGEKYDLIKASLKGGMSLNILLPEAKEDPSSIFLDEESFQNLIALGKKGLPSLTGEFTNLMGYELKLIMPKFHAHEGYNLVKIFPGLGVSDIFDPKKADLSGIAQYNPGEELYVGTALHEAGIDVSVTGIEAAAYTIIAIDEASSAQEWVTEIIDRPFLYSITDSNGLPLFIGNVNQL